MKTLLTFIVTVLTVITVNAENGSYKKSNLKRMNKTTLTEIYLNQVAQLCMNAPYAPFTIFGKDSSNYEPTITNTKMDIPTSDYLQNKCTLTISQSVQYGDVIKKEFYEVLPYSDKRDIITGILYLQKVNEDIKSQKKTSRFFIKRLIY